MRSRIRAAGAALISAIFLIVVLVALGASMANLSNVEHDASAKSILSARVYYGAKAGLEWGIQRAIAANACAASTPFTLTQGSLNGVAVTVDCIAAPQGSATDVVYYISSIAETGTVGSLGYARRSMEATVSNIP